LHVSIDLGQCIGCGVCVQVCPDMFVFDENSGKAMLKEHECDDDGQIKEAVDCCPFGCINE
jgi:ferredoxin